MKGIRSFTEYVQDTFYKVYSRMSDFEKKTFLQFVERIELDPNERDVHKCVKSIKLMFPILVNGVPTDSIQRGVRQIKKHRFRGFSEVGI